MVVIPNASDVELFGPERRDRALLERWAIEDAFVAVHAGTLGRANGLDYLIDAAADLVTRGERDIRFLILGDGGQRSKLEGRVASLGLDNVIFGGGIPREEVGAIVSSCDVAITSFANVPVLATNSPNKFFDGLAAGIPAIVNSAGWTRDLVVDRDAGSYVDPTQPVQLADALIRLRDDPELRDRQGRNARELATTMFSRPLMAERFRSVLEDVANGVPVGRGEVWDDPSVIPPG